jgi:hypothetical protein
LANPLTALSTTAGLLALAILGANLLRRLLSRS